MNIKQKIAKRLGIESLNASEVSEINSGLDETLLMIIVHYNHGEKKSDVMCPFDEVWNT